MRTCYLNGHFVPESEAKLSIYDLSVMQAAAAFEMTRSFHGVHFKLREHLHRLYASCDLLSIPRTRYGFNELYDLCHRVSDLNDHGPGEEHRLLIVVSPGCAEIYKEIEGTTTHPFLYIADFPLKFTVRGFSKYFTEGVHCVTSTIQQVPDACVPSAAKHRSRLHFHLAQQQAPPGTWPLLHDAEGLYAEAPGANLVFVKDGDVFTCESNCLQGISLQTVKDLTNAGIYWHPIARDFLEADEVFLTGTPFCLLPVVSLDGKPIGDGKIGLVYKETLRKWSELVGVDIQQQIVDWDRQKVWTPDAQRLSAAQH